MKAKKKKKKRLLDADTKSLNRLSWSSPPDSVNEENLLVSAPFKKSYAPEERRSTSPAPTNHISLLASIVNDQERSAQERNAQEPREGKKRKMNGIDKSLSTISEITGFIGAALVDCESGMTLGSSGGTPSFNIEMAAAANTEVVRAKMKVMNSLGIDGGIEDILITLQDQYHLIRPLSKAKSLFLYLALSRSQANLGLARHKLASVENDIKV